jgi:hypothetical protein
MTIAESSPGGMAENPIRNVRGGRYPHRSGGVHAARPYASNVFKGVLARLLTPLAGARELTYMQV